MTAVPATRMVMAFRTLKREEPAMVTLAPETMALAPATEELETVTTPTTALVTVERPPSQMMVLGVPEMAGTMQVMAPEALALAMETKLALEDQAQRILKL
jgi:hypothetical protein